MKSADGERAMANAHHEQCANKAQAGGSKNEAPAVGFPLILHAVARGLPGVGGPGRGGMIAAGKLVVAQRVVDKTRERY